MMYSYKVIACAFWIVRVVNVAVRTTHGKHKLVGYSQYISKAPVHKSPAPRPLNKQKGFQQFSED